MRQRGQSSRTSFAGLARLPGHSTYHTDAQRVPAANTGLCRENPADFLRGDRKALQMDEVERSIFVEQEYKVKSLPKAMHLLECFSNEKPELGVTEISKMLGVQKSTVHNIASTFEKLGYLSQNKETGKYYLGVKLLQFSYIVNNHIGFRKFFLPYMKQIAEELHETTYIGIPHGGEVLYIECAYPKESNASRNILGERAPMYCTAIGKAMLAFLPRDKQLEYASRSFYQFTENTIQTQAALLDEISTIQNRGYSIDNMEHEYGITCIGIPIFGNDGRVMAGISISGPSLRFGKETIETKAARMQDILKPVQNKL